MGLGDVKLAGVIGLMTGYPLVIAALALGNGRAAYDAAVPVTDQRGAAGVHFSSAALRTS